MTQNLSRRSVMVLFALSSLVTPALAKVELAGLFVDHMVVQRDRPIPVWGWAAPGESVVARLAGQQKTATADEKGRWWLEFAALPAGGPHTLEIESGEKVTVSDVWVGEVWVCSGQSNMAFEFNQVLDAKKETAEANFPQLRMWHMRHRITLEPQERCQSLSGQWVVSSPASVASFSAVGYFFARELHRKLGLPIGMIHTSWGATSAAQWTSEEAIAAEPKLKVVLDQKRKFVDDYIHAIMRLVPELQTWKTESEKAIAEGRPLQMPPFQQQQLPADPINLYTHLPTGVYNAMLHPITPYSIRGVIWYQGEADNSQAELYRTAFPTLIRDWRQRFRNPDLPFLYVQISTCNEQRGERSTWAELREAQAACLDVPHTAMAVTVDLADADGNAHPRNKQDVGRRLALAARARVYGEKLVYQGPAYQRFQIENGKIRVFFDHVHGGLMTRNGDPPRGFDLAGEDKKFVPASAHIDGDTVILWSDQLAQPVAARYAWADFPLCTLSNREGLPAVPFRTHPW